MNRAEYWLLDLVVEARDRLNVLTHPEIELITNKGTHGLHFEELAEMLYRLCQQGDITTWAGAREVQLSLAGIKAGLSGEAKIFYGLTAQGGDKWEQYSNPNWDRYVDMGFTIDPYEGEIIATTHELVEKSLSYQPAFANLIQNGSEAWDVLSPWQATYWKTLPIGHRVKFAYVPDEKTSWGPAEVHLLEARQRQSEAYWALTRWYIPFLTE
jgi:hypothetical protein